MTLWPSMAEHFNVADRLFGAEGRRRVLDWLDGQDALINEPNMLLHNLTSGAAWYISHNSSLATTLRGASRPAGLQRVGARGMAIP